MKTIIASLALALLVASTSFATTDNTSDDKKAAMQTAVYPTTGTMKLNVIIDNKTDRSATVRLMDQNGDVLASQFVPKTKKPTISRFDLSDLQDGTYQVEISNGYTKELKQVTLQSKKPSAASYRNIALN